MDKKPLTLEEGINMMRDSILRSQSIANTASITGFDNCVEQLKAFVKAINDKDAEIIRLQELCKKNEIDYSIPPPIPTVLQENEVVSPA